MRCLLHSGLESSEWRSRQATALFLSLPTTPLDAVDSALQFELLRATVSLLSDRVDAVTTSAKQALSQLRIAFADGFEVLHRFQRRTLLPSCFHPWRLGLDPSTLSKKCRCTCARCPRHCGWLSRR